MQYWIAVHGEYADAEIIGLADTAEGADALVREAYALDPEPGGGVYGPYEPGKLNRCARHKQFRCFKIGCGA